MDARMRNSLDRQLPGHRDNEHQKQMAAMAKRSKFFCDICEMEFHFFSKYQRHLISASHKRLEAIFDLDPDVITSSTPPSLLEPVSNPADIEPESPLVDCHSLVSNPVMSLDGQLLTPADNSPSEDEFDEADLDEILSTSSDGDDYVPFSSKIHALAFMLVHSPRPMGEGNLKFVFFVMRQLNATLPSLSTIKQMKLPGLATPSQHYTPSGIPFYVNSAKAILKRCMGNPDIASSVARYPVFPDDEIREIFHGRRWREDPRFFSPMAETPAGGVFIHDFVSVRIGEDLVIGRVCQFICKEGIVGVHAQIECLHPVGFQKYMIADKVVVPVAYIELVVSAPSTILQQTPNSASHHILTKEEYEAYTAPHHLKTVAADRPVVMLPLVLYSDDTSGNKSKQWNKFDSWCLKLAGLPNRENSKLHNIHHLCSSNKASPIVDELISLESHGVEAFDALLQTKVLVVAPVLCFICDNPRASEITNNLGPGSKLFCRMCMVDKDDDPSKVSDLRSKSGTLAHIAEIKDKHTEKDKVATRKRFGIKEIPNKLLELPLDLHRSTPVETLHTILLGPYKYMLRSLMGRMTAAQKEEIQARLVSFNYSGFDVKLGYNLCRHYRSFVGRDFKALAQAALFLLGPYMLPEEKILWISLSKVFRIAYCQPFKLSTRSECQHVCEQFVQAVKEHSPELQKKVKIHLLLHLTESMTDFGPTSAFNTERCETFNSLIRARNIFANRLAPSRDIAQGFSVIEHLRFICSGGSLDGSERCGKDLVSLFHSSPIQTFLNGVPASSADSHKQIYQPGAVRKVSTKPVPLHAMKVHVQGVGALTIHQMLVDSKFTVPLVSLTTETLIYPSGAVIGSSLDHELINVGNFVQFSAGPGEVDTGILAACFNVSEHSGVTSSCLVQLFQAMDTCGTQIFNEFDCPLFLLTNVFQLIPSHCISHSVSMFHECTDSCTFKHVDTTVNVEREAVSEFSKLVFLHDYCNNLYSFNVYCLHASHIVNPFMFSV